MKKIHFLYIFLLSSLFVYSQEKNHIYDFFGGKLSDKKTVFYRLVFQINGTKISGYSFTDEHGPKEEKSIIQGLYNPKSNMVFFRESKKLTTRNTDFYAEKCYLNGMVKLEINSQIHKIEGTFTDKTPTGKTCNSGEIRLISPDKFKPEKEKEKLIVKKEKTPKKEIIILPTFNSDKKTTLKTDEELTIFWTSDILKLKIWDDEKEDQDRITISLNDHEILNNYTLKNKEKEIEIPLNKTENTLIITANNTGLIGGNTARIDFIDNKIIHKIISDLQIKKSVTIHLLKNN